MNFLQAKDHLCEQIDTYISHQIVLADSVIEEYAMPKIQNGAVIMTFARHVTLSLISKLLLKKKSFCVSFFRSSVVERVLIAAWTRGKRFSVKVVDSRPMLEGILIIIPDFIQPPNQNLRQKLACSAVKSRYPVYIPAHQWHRLHHIRSIHGIPWRARNQFQWIRLFARWNSAGSNAGERTLCSRTRSQ